MANYVLGGGSRATQGGGGVTAGAVTISGYIIPQLVVATPTGGNVPASTTSGLLVNIAGGVAGAATDNSTAVTSGSTTFTLVGGFYQSPSQLSSIVSGAGGIAALTAHRALHIYPVGATGQNLTTDDALKIVLFTPTGGAAPISTSSGLLVKASFSLATTDSIIIHTATGGNVTSETSVKVSDQNMVFSASGDLRVLLTSDSSAYSPPEDGDTFVTQSGQFLPVGGYYFDPSGGVSPLTTGTIGTLAVSRQRALHTAPYGLPVAVTTDGNMGPRCVTVTATVAEALVSGVAGTAIYVTGVDVSNASGQIIIRLLENSTIRHAMVLASGGGGFVTKFDPPWVLITGATMNGLLTTDTGHAIVNVHYARMTWQ